MPELKGLLKLTEVVLPECGAKCKIGLTYGDRLKMQNALMAEIKFSFQDDKVVRNAEGISALTMQKEAEAKLLCGLKEWDMTLNGEPAPITLENIQMLGNSDGEFLANAIEQLAITELSDEAKKKLPEQS